MSAQENKNSTIMEFIDECLQFKGIINEVRFHHNGSSLFINLLRELEPMHDVISYDSIFERLHVISMEIKRMRKSRILIVTDASLRVTIDHYIILDIKVAETAIK